MATGAEGSELQQFIAQETHLFYSHIAAAAAEYDETHKLPKSLFPSKAVRAFLKTAPGRRGPKAKGPRKLSVYHMFIQETLGKLKEKADPKNPRPHTEVFKEAVARWSALSDDQKKQLSAKYAPLMAKQEAGESVAPEAISSEDARSPSSEEEHKKKKKVRHH